MGCCTFTIESVYPPTQTAVGHSLWRRAKTPGVSPGMNAPGLRSLNGSFGGVGLDGPSGARSAKEGEFPPKKLKIPQA